MKPKTYAGPDHEEHPLDPDELARALQSAHADLRVARALLAQPTPHPDAQGILGRELTTLAETLTLARQLDDALNTFHEAIALWDALPRPRAAFLTRVKLAAALRLASQPHASLGLLQQLLDHEDQESLAFYRDFILHQRGLSARRAGELVLARTSLEEALTLRQRRGAPSLIALTRAALDALSQPGDTP
jgi:hypothetical protein